MNSTETRDAAHVLRCMDIWSGDHSIENSAAAPGLEVFVHSRRDHGALGHRDVYYVSLCAGGVVTRICLADISAQHATADDIDNTVRSIVRRNMNAKNQARLVRDLSGALMCLRGEERFVSAVVATYLSNRKQFTLYSAGPLRPLWYISKFGRWSSLSGESLASDGALDASAANQERRLSVADGDILVLCTDGTTAARSGDGRPLGTNGLLQIVAGLPTDNAQALARGIAAAVTNYSGGRSSGDDATIFVVKFSAACRRFPGFRERLHAYARLLGLKPT